MNKKNLVRLGGGIFALKTILSKVPLCSICNKAMTPVLNFKCGKCGRFHHSGFWNEDKEGK